MHGIAYCMQFKPSFRTRPSYASSRVSRPTSLSGATTSTARRRFPCKETSYQHAAVRRWCAAQPGRSGTVQKQARQRQSRTRGVAFPNCLLGGALSLAGRAPTGPTCTICAAPARLGTLNTGKSAKALVHTYCRPRLGPYSERRQYGEPPTPPAPLAALPHHLVRRNPCLISKTTC